MRRIWREHIAGPTLRSYDEACEELGGVPWRPAQDETDRWFLTTRPHPVITLPSVDKLATLDTGAISLKRTMSDRMKLIFLGGAVLLAIGITAMVLARGARAARPERATVTPATTVAPAPATTATVTAVVTPPSARALALPAPIAPPVAVRKHLFVRKHRR
jgi:hypothetical protein